MTLSQALDRLAAAQTLVNEARFVAESNENDAPELLTEVDVAAEFLSIADSFVDSFRRVPNPAFLVSACIHLKECESRAQAILDRFAAPCVA